MFFMQLPGLFKEVQKSIKRGDEMEKVRLTEKVKKAV